MKKLSFILLIIFATMITACSNHYDNEEVVAIVGDKEITVADVRLFYNLEEKELIDATKDYVKEEIMVQEAKKMGLDVTKKLEELNEMNTPFPFKQTKEQKEYAQKLAKDLDMTEEELYEKYLELSNERSAYIMAFLDNKIGKLGKEEDGEEYVERVNKFVDSLLTTYSDNMEILIK